MASLGTLALDVVAKTGPFDKALRKSQGNVNVFAGSMKGLVSGFGSVATAAAQAGLKVAAFGAAGAAAFTVFAVKAAADLETTKTAFETMLGSAQKADKVVGGLFDFSKRTPFEPDEVFKAGRQLLATGSDTRELQKEIRILGDLASGTNSRLGDLAEIYGRIRTKGKASMEEMNRLTERAINIIPVMSKQLGKSRDELFKMISDGKIGLPEVAAAMEEMTAEGGMFFESMQKQSETFNGVWSTMMGNFKAGSAEFGQAFTETARLTEGLKAISATLEKFDWKTFGKQAAESFALIADGALLATTAIHALSKAYSGSVLAGLNIVKGAAKVTGNESLETKATLGKVVTKTTQQNATGCLRSCTTG